MESGLDAMMITLAVAFGATGACCWIHLHVLRWLKRLVDQPQLIGHPLLAIIFALFATHLIEVLLFALVLSGLDLAGFGRLVGAVIGGPGWFEDHFYFSIAAYTTLGLGDIMPEGPIRIIAGIEALTGLIMVAWSASFTYLAMERMWTPGAPTEDLD